MAEQLRPDDEDEDPQDYLDEDQPEPGTPLFLDWVPSTLDDFTQSFLADVNRRRREHYRRAQLLSLLVVRQGQHADLLREARHVFILGYHYAAVAMCGIAAERIVKDLLRQVLRLLVGDEVKEPPQSALEQFERAEISVLARFLKDADVLKGGPFQATWRLIELRNKYAHARGQNAERDAEEAIRLLHTLVDGTVAVDF